MEMSLRSWLGIMIGNREHCKSKYLCYKSLDNCKDCKFNIKNIVGIVSNRNDEKKLYEVKITVIV